MKKTTLKGPEMIDLLVKNGTLVTAEEVFSGDIGIRDGKIHQVAAPGTLSAATRTIDAQGLLVLPGLVDPHVHFGHRVHLEHGWVSALDDFATGSAFAAAGGTTTAIDFAVQRESDVMETLEARRAETEAQAVIDFSLHSVLTETSTGTVDRLPELIEAGFPTFKLYMLYKAQGRMGDDALLLAALDASAREKGMTIVHAENAAMMEFNVARLVAEGRTTAADFAKTKPNIAEAEAINRALFLAEQTGGSLYVFHTSTRDGVELIRRAQERGVAAYAETCPHYLTLTEEVLAGPDGHRLLCSPPLRTTEDSDALWQALADGVIQVVSSDHCGYGAEVKDLGRDDFRRGANGLPGAGLRLPLIHSHGVRTGRLSLSEMVAVLSTNAARLFGFAPAKGTITPGADADLVLFDPDKERVVRAAELESPVDWSPYEGMPLTGWPVMTLSRGEVIAEDGKCVAMPGRGRIVHRRSAGLAAFGPVRGNQGVSS
jgi:dihydropyrimidinase